jgi:hypothetical protein
LNDRDAGHDAFLGAIGAASEGAEVLPASAIALAQPRPSIPPAPTSTPKDSLLTTYK